MTDMTRRPGSFCTSMLYTRDMAQARAFYERVLPGWSFESSSDDPRHVTITVAGQPVAHARLAETDQEAWVPMVRVQDLDASLQAAAMLGATVVDTERVHGVAHIARLRDLEAATFGLSQPAPDEGSTVSNVVGSLWWLELLTLDPENAMQFYGRLFGWQARTTAFPPFDTYVVFERDGQQEGGLLPIDAEWDVLPRWNTLVAVADADAACRDAEMLGGCTHFVHTVPSAGRIAGVSDPNGASLVVRGPVPSA